LITDVIEYKVQRENLQTINNIYFRLTDWHIVEVETWGPGSIDENTAFHVKTVRRNPSRLGVVTRSATYASFFSSILGRLSGL
jgi:hypothetical protein